MGSELYRCPSCDEVGSFVEEYAVVENKEMPFGDFERPDYDTQLMKCRTEDCRVYHYGPWEGDAND